MLFLVSLRNVAPGRATRPHVLKWDPFAPAPKARACVVPQQPSPSNSHHSSLPRALVFPLPSPFKKKHLSHPVAEWGYRLHFLADKIRISVTD